MNPPDVGSGLSAAWRGRFPVTGSTGTFLIRLSTGSYWIAASQTASGMPQRLAWYYLDGGSSDGQGHSFGYVGNDFFTGNFSGVPADQQQLLFYLPADGNWWLGTVQPNGANAYRLPWALAGNTSGANGSPWNFGDISGCRFFVGRFAPSSDVRRNQILFYSSSDQHWWLGQFSGTQLSWSLVGNTAGFGTMADSRPMWTGSFSLAAQQSAQHEVLMYSPGDTTWWLGQFTTGGLTWVQVGNTAGFGQVGDGRPFWTGNFTGTGQTDILFYSPSDKNWWVGHLTSMLQLVWSVAGNTAGFGQVYDGRPFFSGNFSGNGRTDMLFYSPGDGNWFIGQFSGTSLTWSLAGSSSGFGDISAKPMWALPMTDTVRDSVLFYSPPDGNWFVGDLPGGHLTWTYVGNTKPAPPPPKPTVTKPHIASFGATTTADGQGGSITFTWQVTSAAPCTVSLTGQVGLTSILNIPSVPLSGSRTVQAGQSGQYVLWAQNDGGLDTWVQYVAVGPPAGPSQWYWFKMTNPDNAVQPCFTEAYFAPDQDTAKSWAEGRNVGYTATPISVDDMNTACG